MRSAQAPAPATPRSPRKGISPIVATVLMVAVAVTIGVLVMNWATSWTAQRINDRGTQCAVNTNYIVESAKWNYSSSTNQLLLKITNKGTQKLWNFSVTLDNTTRVMNFNSTNTSIGGNVNETNAIKQEEAVVLSVNLAMDTTFGSSLAKVTVLNEGCKAVAASTTSITNYP